MRYFLYIAYDGTDFLGWQRQPEGRTVQGVLEERLSTIARRPLEVVGAGRTDTGVHAREMVCHIDLNMEPKEVAGLCHRLRRFLPDDMALLGVRQVTPEAHARYDALSRRYLYRLRTDYSPFERRYSAITAQRLDFDAMNRAAESLLGEHDFTTFSKKHSQVRTHLCRVTEAAWEEGAEPGSHLFHITADRFLRNMVRAIVGTLLEVGRGRMTPEEFVRCLDARDRSLAGTSAPAGGLFMEMVTYPEVLFVGPPLQIGR